VTYLRWDVSRAYDVVFTTRVGGVSEGPFSSLNLGRKTGDDVGRVDENRRRACAEIGGDAERLALNYQFHSTLVHRARAGSRGERGDGLWTDEPDLPILAMSADCLPVALARTNGGAPAVAVVHVGWRGLVDGILASAVAALGGDELAAAIGPGIGPCCYEVRDDVADPFRARFGGGIVREGKLDLWRSAEAALREAGVTRVDRFDLCTSCRPEQFFSHRRDGKLRGVQGVLARVA
jgi:YfiH family protein